MAKAAFGAVAASAAVECAVCAIEESLFAFGAVAAFGDAAAGSTCAGPGFAGAVAINMLASIVGIVAATVLTVACGAAARILGRARARDGQPQHRQPGWPLLSAAPHYIAQFAASLEADASFDWRAAVAAAAALLCIADAFSIVVDDAVSVRGPDASADVPRALSPFVSARAAIDRASSVAALAASVAVCVSGAPSANPGDETTHPAAISAAVAVSIAIWLFASAVA